MATQPPNTALVILVREFEPIVSKLRLQYDPSARQGMQAHITTLIPFVKPVSLNAEILEKTANIIAQHSPFTFSFHKIGQFPGVVYFSPSNTSPFIELTNTIYHNFPEYPPYEGKVEAIIPHMTVGYAKNKEIQNNLAKQAKHLLSKNSDISCTVNEITLIENLTGQWKKKEVFPLKNI